LKVKEEIKEEIISALRSERKEFLRKSRNILKLMEKAKTVEELLHLKKLLMEEYLYGIPISSDTCYFCCLYVDKVCEGCPYGEVHGVCTEPSSDYYKFMLVRRDLVDMLENYYKGESYEEVKESESGEQDQD